VHGKLIDLIQETDGPQNLLIIYYVGLSVYNDLYGSLDLVPATRPDVAKSSLRDIRFNWGKTESLLDAEDIESDVLIIFDAPYYSHLAQKRESSLQSGPLENTRKNSKQLSVLAACTIDEKVQAPGDFSFTRTLIDVLLRLLKEHGTRPISTSRLHLEISKDERRRFSKPRIRYLSNNQPIFLKPMPLGGGRVSSYSVLPARGRLNLSLELRDRSLDKEQVDFLAKRLAETLRNQSLLGVRKIEWRGFEAVQTSFFGQLSVAMYALVRWRNITRRRRAEQAVEICEPHNLLEDQ
jgi:hypothetical protein